MAIDLSGFGFSITILSVPTIPIGYTLTAFADDSDPFDVPTITTADYSMGLNGDLILNRRAVPLPINLNIIPHSADDQVLETLLEVNRVAKNKAVMRDVITLSANYPDGTVKIFTNGTIIGGNSIASIGSEGRIRTKQYNFVFEGKVS